MYFGFRRFVYDNHVSLGFYGVVFLLLMSLTGPSWSFHRYRQRAMTMLGGDVRNMEHHGYYMWWKRAHPRKSHHK
ncbi:MAG: PepSY domain-containing protein [Prevotella sp.]|nr:PepSY domain-containing protein [Prevotella sp.]